MTNSFVTPRRLLGASCSALLAAAIAAGCIVNDGAPSPSPQVEGDIAFSWSFNGEPSCDAAGVDEIDLVVLQDGEVVFVLDHEPCTGGGLVLTDFLPGRYDVEIDAYDRESTLRFHGAFSVRVEGGRENDVGVVVLAPAAPTSLAVGDISLFWTFRYPTSDPIIDCARAGVESVEIQLVENDQPVLTERFDCTDEGAVFSGLTAGRWRLQLTGIGRAQGASIELYRAFIDVEVVGGDEQDLGDVALDRVDRSFANLRIQWVWPDSTCAAEGVGTFEVRIVRDGLAEPEDIATVSCAAVSVTRSTFVPAAYTISVRGAGTTTTWSSTSTVALPPGATTDVTLVLSSSG
jgi:hypothetical protein